MVMRVTGIIKGRRIELDRETGLNDGARVDVRIEHSTPPLDELRRRVDALCGAWGADESLGVVFDEIERARLTAAPREVRFDATS